MYLIAQANREKKRPDNPFESAEAVRTLLSANGQKQARNKILTSFKSFITKRNVLANN